MDTVQRIESTMEQGNRLLQELVRDHGISAGLLAEFIPKLYNRPELPTVLRKIADIIDLADQFNDENRRAA